MPEAAVIPISSAMNAPLDLVDGFLDFSEGIPSPEIFRLWAGIGLVASALERRVWVEVGPNILFPNLYILLTANPGVGKSQAIKLVEDLLCEIKELKLAPDSMTAAAMLDSLAEAKRVIVRDGKVLAEFHSLILPADEFSVFCPAYDLEFLGRLNKIYDCPRQLRVRRKYLKEEVNIRHPQLNILSGAQPGLLQSLLPDAAWSMGFTRRLLLIYSHSGPKIELFSARPDQSKLKAELVRRLRELGLMFGRFFWEKDAAQRLARWHAAGGPPVPTHSRLSHYNAVRTMHASKLAVVASASRAADYRITLIDVERALTWLLQAEDFMPDVFREMKGTSDGELIKDLHFYLWRIWAKDKKAIHSSRLVYFLQDRMPHEKIFKLIEVAEKANFISREAGTELYVPKPSIEHGMID